MKERPIIFTGDDVRATRAEQKTQLRGIVKSSPGRQSVWLTPELIQLVPHGEMIEGGWQMHHPKAGQRHMGVDVAIDSPLGWVPCPLGVVGDRLWVKEAFAVDADGKLTTYMADKNGIGWMLREGRTKPPRRMIRDDSRLTLEIVSVRVERLQDISEEDAKAEGIAEPSAVHGSWCDPARGREGHWSYRKPFAKEWDALHGKGAWEANPWVWRIEFKRVVWHEPVRAGRGVGLHAKGAGPD